MTSFQPNHSVISTMSYLFHGLSTAEVVARLEAEEYMWYTSPVSNKGACIDKPQCAVYVCTGYHCACSLSDTSDQPQSKQVNTEDKMNEEKALDEDKTESSADKTKAADNETEEK
jgi:hypothetical protein